MATHVPDEIEHSRPDLSVLVAHQSLNVLIGVDKLYRLVDVLGVARYLGEEVTGLHGGIGDLMVYFEELEAHE